MVLLKLGFKGKMRKKNLKKLINDIILLSVQYKMYLSVGIQLILDRLLKDKNISKIKCVKKYISERRKEWQTH